MPSIPPKQPSVGSGWHPSKRLLYFPREIQGDIMKAVRGFTLIEVLTVVALIGILSAIALPAYSNYVTRGKIPDATSNLAAKRVLMEQYFQDNHSYLLNGACPFDTPATPDVTSSKYFAFTCLPAATGAGYTYTATGIAPGTMAGFSYTVDQSNNKASTIVAPARSSWIATRNSCWIINKGGQC
jgi:type IV pilus assembly protein PilE